jgi:AcrR family transcriptional regulator
MKWKDIPDTRKIILDCAAEQFAMWGYAGASIADIAASVGISKPALYHHFPNKEALYFAIVISALRRMCELAMSRTEGVSEPGQQLREFMTAHAEFLDEERNAFIAAHFGFLGLRGSQRDEALEWRDRYEELLRSILRGGLHSGTFSFEDEGLAARLVLSVLNWMARWYHPNGKLSAVEIAVSFHEMLRNGLSPQSKTTARRKAAATKRSAKKPPRSRAARIS